MAQPTTDFGNRTVAAMATKVYQGIKRRPSDPVGGLSETAIVDYVAHWDAYFCDYARWTFRRTSKVLPHYASTTLYSALATSDLYAHLTSNASALATGGRIVIGHDEIDYSAKDTPTSGRSVTISTASGAKAADLSHSAGEEVRFLVPVPTDFGKPGELWHGTATDPASVKLKHLDNRRTPWPPSLHYFCQDGYLYLPRGLPSGRLFLVYYKKAKKPVSGDDLQTPEKYDDFVLWAAMAQCFQVIGDDDRASFYFLQAGIPTPQNPSPSGILQVAAARDAEQTDSLDETFTPDF